MAVLELDNYVVTMPLNYPTLPITANALDVVFTAAGAAFADGARWTLTGRDILIVQNANVGAQTVTITSQRDSRNRTGDISAYSIGIGEFAVFPLFQQEGWADSSGFINIAASASDVKFLVLRLRS